MARCDDCRLPTETNQPDSGDGGQTRCGPCVALADSDRSIRLSPLERDDLELVMAWRSNPEIYRLFGEQDGPLEWTEHVSWFESRAADRHDFTIHFDGRRVGVISLDAHDEVGIYLGDFSAHGQGVATMSLEWLCDRFEHRTPLTAEIHEENEGSKRLFTRCGFRQVRLEDEWHQYVYDP